MLNADNNFIYTRINNTKIYCASVLKSREYRVWDLAEFGLNPSWCGRQQKGNRFRLIRHWVSLSEWQQHTHILLHHQHQLRILSLHLNKSEKEKNITCNKFSSMLFLSYFILNRTRFYYFCIFILNENYGRSHCWDSINSHWHQVF